VRFIRSRRRRRWRHPALERQRTRATVAFTRYRRPVEALAPVAYHALGVPLSDITPETE
jgi:hypothetical protein